MTARYEFSGARASSGLTIGTYETYLEAQQAAGYLSDEGVPLEDTAIVGNNLRSVEHVLGRWTWARAISAGLAVGGWFGVLVGVLLVLLVPPRSRGLILAVLVGAVLGAVFGVALGVIGYCQLRGRRDLLSTTAAIAATYDVRCDGASAEVARRHLARLAMTGDIVPLSHRNDAEELATNDRRRGVH